MTENHVFDCEISRRRILQAAAVGAGAIAMSGISTRVAMAADPAASGDVLVVLTLRGGFDGTECDRSNSRSALRHLAAEYLTFHSQS